MVEDFNKHYCQRRISFDKMNIIGKHEYIHKDEYHWEIYLMIFANYTIQVLGYFFQNIIETISFLNKYYS